MQYRTLGRTGIKVSPYCLGAMMFGRLANPDHDDCIRIIHKALDFGINFVDTADRYSQGESEEIVGKALKGRRDRIVLATKVHGPMGEDPNQQGNSRRWITQAVEASLRRLQTDHIDLYQIHRPAPDTDIEETLSALTDLMRAREKCARSAHRPSRPRRSWKHSGRRNGAGSPASAPSSRPTPFWIAASSVTCSRPASVTGWA
jgi:aryl-alcohol dehydrogenase-like predicted oxidoreductase